MTAAQRNKAARKHAEAVPVVLIEYAAVGGRAKLSFRLDAWLTHNTEPGEIATLLRGADNETSDANDTPEWRALLLRDHLEQWKTREALRRLGMERTDEEIALSFIDIAASLPDSPTSTTGLSLLTTLIEEMPRTVKADRRPRAILPASLRDAKRNADVLPLALDRDTPLGPIQEPKQGYLPGLEPPPSVVPPVPWLTLYDLTGTSPVQTRGRGAPLAQRLFVEVLTAVHHGERDPEWITAPPITLRDLFEWCWPRYFDAAMGRERGGYDRSKHLEPLRRALVEMDNMRIEYGRYDRRLIRVDDLPTAATALDDPILFHVRHLPGSDRGPMFERARARRWGVVSAPTWRATIRLAYLWDAAKQRNNGSRVYATRPVVARGLGGVVLGVDNRPLRDRRGAVVKNWADDRAVPLGVNGKPAGDGNQPAYERNPAADRVPVLGPDDLIRLAFDDNLNLSDAARRKRLFDARKALRSKEAAGEVVIEDDGDGWRIVEATPIPIRGNADPDTW